jgi:DnaD/phage-associated family protein
MSDINLPHSQSNSSFNGFPSGKVRLSPIPAPFFTDLLPQIDHLGEMKVTLYTLWFLDQLEGNYRCVSRADYAEDELLMQGLGGTAEALDDALERAVRRGTLLCAALPEDGGRFYFLNSVRGRAAFKAFQEGSWSPLTESHQPIALDLEKPNIYRLYEENIGPLTPLIADTLRDAEQEYPTEWIEEAIRTAVQSNVRRWKYIEAILRRWKEEGRHDQDRRDSQKDRSRYFDGEFSDLIHRG